MLTITRVGHPIREAIDNDKANSLSRRLKCLLILLRDRTRARKVPHKAFARVLLCLVLSEKGRSLTLRDRHVPN